MKKLLVALVVPVVVGALANQYRKQLTKITGTWIGEPQDDKRS